MCNVSFLYVFEFCLAVCPGQAYENDDYLFCSELNAEFYKGLKSANGAT